MEIKKVDLKWKYDNTPISLDKVEKLILHHMATDTDIYRLHEYHQKSRGWNGVGYNYFIDKDGSIYEGRGMTKGAHSGAEWNDRSIGIGFNGDFDVSLMNDNQVESGAWLCAHFIRLSGNRISVNDIIGHHDVAATACPGSNFRMDDIKKRVSELLGKEEEKKYIYRVQVGAFSVRENAEKLADKLKSQGYDVLIRKDEV